MWRYASVLGMLLISPIPALARQASADRPRIEIGGHVSILPDCGFNSCGSSAVKAGPRFAVNFASRAAAEVDVDIQVGSATPTRSVLTLAQVKYTLHHFSRGGVFMTFGGGIRHASITYSAYTATGSSTTFPAVTRSDTAPVFMAGGGIEQPLSDHLALHGELQIVFGGDQAYGYLAAWRFVAGVMIPIGRYR